MRIHVLLTGLVSASLLTAHPASADDGARGKLVYSAKDEASQADVRVYKASATDVTLEIAQGPLVVSNHLATNRAILSVRDRASFLTMTLDRSGVAISDGRGTTNVSAADPRQGGEEARARVAGSPLLTKAAALLARIQPTVVNPLTHQIRSTRALLLLLSGDPSGREDLGRWVRRLPSRSVKPVAFEQGPTDCWNLYAFEAIQAFLEYEQCYDGIAWYDFWTGFMCDIIYDLRALGAFSWWIGCVAFN